MRISDLSLSRFLLLHFCLFLIPIAAWPQTASPQSRIVERVDESALVALRGNTHPLAQSQFDQGAAPPDLPMARMLLVLKRSDAQESALQTLLDAQQDQNSPSYHQWLTPDAFGQQFGLSDQDIQTITSWLRSHGFHIGGVSLGHTVIEFSGTALQVQQAFHTEIHKYVMNGEGHWANASDPQIPAALSPVVAGVNSLHNFPKRPMYRLAGKFANGKNTGPAQALGPEFTTNNVTLCGGTGNCYFVGPYDFASIYNVLPLWNATPAIDGTGQTIAIVNESNINIQDIRDFRNLFGLPASDPIVILNGPDPGLVPGAETEADLDVEWSGAVAKGATIKLVVTAPTNATEGVDLSAIYAIENSVAPIISESFGECELFLGNAGNTFQNAIRQQAAAQGITFINASGDEGSAGCDRSSGNPPQPAAHGLAVSGLASSPYGVAVGGTDFLNFGSTYNLNSPSPYWGSTNDPQHQASALGYVPETTWNDTCTNYVFVFTKAGANPEASCNNPQFVNAVDTVGGGGGKSSCTTSDAVAPASCTGGYAKPSWQVAPGVPSDSARDIPDVSLFASAGFMDSAYILCESDRLPSPQPCSLNNPMFSYLGIGGTSASAPAFAGIMALVNQFTGSSGQGNANYVLYKLASSSAQTSLACGATSNPASGCIFHDVTSGTIAVPCTTASPNCVTSIGSDVYGVLSGYSAGAGYDLATGLGSVNAFNLVHNWIQPTTPSTTTLSLNGGAAVSITHGQGVSFSIAVTPSAAPGSVSLMGSPSGSGFISMASFPLQNGAASGTTASLAGGTAYAVKAHYPGNGTYTPSDSTPVTVTVAPEPSKTLITVPTFDSTGRETGNTPTSVAYGSSVAVRVDVGNSQATTTFPPKLVCALLTCPTGSVTLTDTLNGTTATISPAGGFALNTGGFAIDYVSVLSGGVHQLASTYSGDNSYQTSTAAYSITVTPVATSIGQTFTVTTPVVGTPFYATVIGYSQASSGVAPTGTVTFYDGKTQIGSSGPISGYPAGYLPQFFANGTLTVVSGGARTISAQYSGDANYAASTTSTTVNALYPATASISVSPSTVNYGASLTITGVVDTAIPATNAALKPTGTVLVGASLGGNNISAVTTTTNADPSGNWQIQVSATAIPSGSEAFNLNYSGDSNYAPATGSSNMVTVNIPDFSLGPAAGITIAPVAGQAGSAQLTVTPLSQTPSPVTLSVYPAISISGYTIAITPQTTNLNGAPATATISLTPTVTAPTNSIRSQVRLESLIGTGRSVYWPLSAATGLAALFLIAIPRRPRKYRAALGLITFCFVLFVLGCGGGSPPSGGGGGSGGSGPQPTTITLSTSSAKIARNTPLPITATVSSGSGNVITGSVTFYNFGAAFGSGYSIVNGQYTFQGNVGELGIYQVTASYSGDSNHLPSTTPSPLIQTVTGSVPVTITGNTGVVSHSLPATIGLQ
jgi:hypothetical protein